MRWAGCFVFKCNLKVELKTRRQESCAHIVVLYGGGAALGCSGLLVRSFLLAVKPQHAHISIRWPSSVQLCSKQQKSVCGVRGPIVFPGLLPSQYNPPSHPPVLLLSHTPKPSNVMRSLSLTKPPRPRSELQRVSFSASPTSLSCITM